MDDNYWRYIEVICKYVNMELTFLTVPLLATKLILVNIDIFGNSSYSIRNSVPLEYQCGHQNET